MGQPLVMGDKIQGQCAIHQIPNPALGRAAAVAPPMPFSAPLLAGPRADRDDRRQGRRGRRLVGHQHPAARGPAPVGPVHGPDDCRWARCCPAARR